MGERACVGYIVLTEQPDGSWKDDWDGEVHASLSDAEESLSSASGALAEGCKIVSLHEVAPVAAGETDQ